MSRKFGPLVLAWLLLSFALTVTLVYAYAFVLPQYIGFEKTLLLGVAMLTLRAANTD